MKLAEKCYAELMARGVEVILDDRDERPGVKFKGTPTWRFPIRLALGEKITGEGRSGNQTRGGALMPVKISEAVERVAAMVQGVSV